MRMVAFSHSINRITKDLQEILDSDTNILLTTSSGEKSIRRLVDTLNIELKKLLTMKREYSKGILDLRYSAENVAHDIRTPLTAIKGYVELMKKVEMEKEGREYLEIIGDRVDYMKSLTDELFLSLSMKNRKSMNKEKIECKRILEEALVSFYCDFEKKGIEPTVTMPEENVYIKGNSKAIFRVYVNIISNALKYGGGVLKVEMDNKGNTVFSNPAPNMDSVDTNRLLDRYYTIRDGKASSGIGLSISKEIVEEMGGELGVKLEDGILYISISYLAH